MSTQEKKVIEYLQSVWGKDNSVTSVDQAMTILGLRPSDETAPSHRPYIKQHPETARGNQTLGLGNASPDAG